MREITIKNCVNPKPAFNSTNLEASIIADRISGRGWKNLLYRFQPIEVNSIILLPATPETEVEKDAFDAAMFKPGGLLAETPMNHFLTVTQGDKHCMINAGYLARFFYFSNKAAYTELKRLLQFADQLECNK